MRTCKYSGMGVREFPGNRTVKNWIPLILSARLEISFENFSYFGKTCLHEDMQILRHGSMLDHQIDTLLYLFTSSIYTIDIFI